MLDFIMQPWPWWFSGILIGLTVPLMFLLAGKAFGISTSFQEIGAMCAPGRLEYLRGPLSQFRDNRLCWDARRHVFVRVAEAEVATLDSLADAMVPQAMAYAMLAGLPPQVGLYAHGYLHPVDQTRPGSRLLFSNSLSR